MAGLHRLLLSMPDYSLFGGVFRSQLEFPELAAVSRRPPSWLFCQATNPPRSAGLEVLGREEVEQGVNVTLARHQGGLRLTFDDTGIFEVSDDGRRILWHAPESPDVSAVRKDVLGRVLAVALDQQGIITLHGSAVALGQQAVAFLAPKFHGKSTTATALVNSGGRLLADDLVPVTTSTPPMILPSIPVVQLWGDSAERVVGDASSLLDKESSPKVQVAWGEADRNATSAVRMAAVYLLAPVEAESATGVVRTRVSGVEAALGLLGQTKVGALLGAARRMEMLPQLAELSERVPVYRLQIPRDFARIDELTSGLWGWHSDPGAIGAPA